MIPQSAPSQPEPTPTGAPQQPPAPAPEVQPAAVPSASNPRPGIFRGRISRLGYLAFCGYALLGTILIGVVFGALFYLIGLAGPDTVLYRVVSVLAFLVGAAAVIAIIVVSLGVSIRRWHDIGQPGWFILLNLVPIVSLIVAILMFVMPGNPGPNKYGQPFTGAGKIRRVFGLV